MADRPARDGRALGVAVAVALHAGVLVLIDTALSRGPQPAGASATGGVLWLLPERPAAPAVATPNTTRPAANAPAAATAVSRRRAIVPPAHAAPAIEALSPRVDSAEAAPRGDVRAEAPYLAPPASAASSVPGRREAGSILDTPATRRAIRELGRSETLADRGARAQGDTLRTGPDPTLGQAIERAGIGDCLKGEYAGGGMGVLSLPFFIAAELRGKCRR